MKKHTLIALGLAALLAISQVNVTLAYTESVYPYFAGTSHAVATQNAYIVSSSAWNANIQSFTIVYFGASPGSGQAIGTIGWTWWTFREVCN